MTEAVADYVTNGATPLNTTEGVPPESPPKRSRKKAEPDELDILFPDVAVNTKQGKFTVSPFVFKNFKRVLDLVKKYSSIVKEQPEADLFDLIISNAETGTDDVIEFIQMCCPIATEQIENLRIDEMIDLFMTAVEVNRDFLLLRLQESGLRSALVTGAPTGATLSVN
jgi:hypothetical protein